MGQYSWHVGQLHAAHVRIHYSTALVPITFLLLGVFAGFGLPQHIHLLALTMATGLCLVAHELGHVLVAHLFGVQTQSVTLYPFGAMSRLAAEPETPGEDIMIAMAGPMISLMLACVFLLLSSARGFSIPDSTWALARADIFGQLGVVNMAIAGLNLVPVLPLDGGRIVRSFLALSLPHNTATRVAMWFSVATAGLCFILGFTTDPGYFIAAAFIWFGSTREAYSTDAKTLLRHKVVGEYLAPSVKTIPAEMELQKIFDKAISHPQKDFPVSDHGKVIGFLSRSEIKKGLRGAREAISVRSILRTDFHRLSADTPVEEAIAYMAHHQLSLVPVFENGDYLGSITKYDALHAMQEQTVQQEMVYHSSRNLL